MGKKSLEKIYNALVKNLWNDLLFYISDTDLAIVFFNELKLSKEIDLFNIVFIMDRILGPIEYKIKKDYKLLSKNAMLEESMYFLLKKQRKLEEQEFNFVFDNYFEQAEFCFYITNWFHEDLKINTSIKLNQHQLGLFTMQYQAYKKHFEKLIKHFYPKRDSLPIGNFNVKATIEKYFPELLKKYSAEKNNVVKRDQIIIPITSRIQPEESEKKGNAITKQQSTPKPTQQEVEIYLLENVFGIQ